MLSSSSPTQDGVESPSAGKKGGTGSWNRSPPVPERTDPSPYSVPSSSTASEASVAAPTPLGGRPLGKAAPTILDLDETDLLSPPLLVPRPSVLTPGAATGSSETHRPTTLSSSMSNLSDFFRSEQRENTHLRSASSPKIILTEEPQTSKATRHDGFFDPLSGTGSRKNPSSPDLSSVRSFPPPPSSPRPVPPFPPFGSNPSPREDDQAVLDELNEKVLSWKHNKERNIRALMTSMTPSLWPPVADWPPLHLTDLLTPAKVKLHYLKLIAKVHPDKVSHHPYDCVDSFSDSHHLLCLVANGLSSGSVHGKCNILYIK